MIESPILMELIAEQKALAKREMILDLLSARFPNLPTTIKAQLESYATATEIREIHLLAANAPSLEHFLSHLPTPALATA